MKLKRLNRLTARRAVALASVTAAVAAAALLSAFPTSADDLLAHRCLLHGDVTAIIDRFEEAHDGDHRPRPQQGPTHVRDAGYR